MNKILCGCLLCFVFLCPLLGAVDLLEQSNQRRLQAEQALQQQRAQHLKQRQALLETFSELQQRLNNLKQESKASDKQLQRLQEQLAQSRQVANDAADNLGLTINRISSALGVAAPSDHSPQHCRQLWTSSVESQLQLLDKQSTISIEKAQIAARNGSPIAARLIHCGSVQRLAISDNRHDSGFVIKSSDAFVVNGPLINEFAYNQLQQLDAQQGGFIIADVEGSLKTQTLSNESWSDWIQKGGFFVWPILCVGLVAFILASERIMHVLRLRINPMFLQTCANKLRAGEIDAVKQSVSERANPLERVLACGIDVIDYEQNARESAVEASLLAEEADLDRSRSLLAVMAAVAPLLGLLGTVTGMIATFQSIALYGTANPALLSNGISEALITTQLGLIVAVPILLVHGFINRIAEKRRIILEQAAGHVMSVQ